MRKTKHRGCVRVLGDFMINLVAYNLVPNTQADCGLRSPTGGGSHRPDKEHQAESNPTAKSLTVLPVLQQTAR